MERAQPGAFLETMKYRSLHFYVSRCDNFVFIVKRYFFFNLDKKVGEQKMNLMFGFTIREISEVKDSDQVLTIPMYLSIHWMVCDEYYVKS